MVKTKQEISNWIENIIGKSAEDWDGCAGKQCPDLIFKYAEDLGLGYFATYDGYKCAEQFAKQFSKYAEFIPWYTGFEPQLGDVISFNSSTAPKHGHVGIVAGNVDGAGRYPIAEMGGAWTKVQKNIYTVTAPTIYKRSGEIIGVARLTISSGDNVIQTPQKPVSLFPTGTVLKRNKINNRELVKTLQNVLNQKGNYGLVIDGSFGPLTEKAVKDFQKNNGLEVDGYVGPKTIAVLNLV